MDGLNSFLAGSRWVWLTILVIGLLAVATRVMGW